MSRPHGGFRYAVLCGFTLTLRGKGAELKSARIAGQFVGTPTSRSPRHLTTPLSPGLLVPEGESQPLRLNVTPKTMIAIRPTGHGKMEEFQN